MSFLRNFLVLFFLLTNVANANFTIKSGETVNLTSNEVLVIDGDLTIESGGVLNGVSSSEIQVSGSWKNSGSYNHGGSSVYFTGSSVSQITGSNSFYNLISDFSRADTSSGKTLIFESGSSQSVVNHLQIKGATSNNLVILSTVPGTIAYIDLNGATFDVSNVSVKDNTARNVAGGAINPTGSVNSGNTENWFINDENNSQDMIRSPIFDKGVALRDEGSREKLQGLQNQLANIQAEVDPSNPSKRFSIYTDLDKTDQVTITSGHPDTLGDRDGLIQVDDNVSTTEAYIDVNDDKKPDFLWNPTKNLISEVNMVIEDEVDDISGRAKELTNARGYPLGHKNSEPILSSRPALTLSGPQGHKFRLWGYSDSNFGPVTGWKTIPNEGQIVLTDIDYTKPLDFGNNLIVMRGSASLPVALNVSGEIRISKKANTKEVSVGKTVLYSIDLENISNTLQSDVGLTDMLPAGFRYVEGSALYNGKAIIPQKINGEGLHFPLGSMPVGSAIKTLQYQLAVGAGVNSGTYENTAVAVDTNGTTSFNDDVPLSVQASTTVKVVNDALFDFSTIMGKVYHDRNEDGVQNEGEEPIPHAVLLTSTGQQIRTDINGQYHLPYVIPGRMVIRVDERSLPIGTVVVGHKSKVADVRTSIPIKVNFGVQIPKDTNIMESQRLVIQQLLGKPQAMLNIASFGRAQWNQSQARLVEPLEIRMYSNYAAFIQNWTVTVREQYSGKVVKTFKGDRTSLFDPIWWDGSLDESQGQLDRDKQYTIQLMVEDEHSHKAITYGLPIEINYLDGDTFKPSRHAKKLASLRVKLLAKLQNTDRTKKNAIRIVGRTVQINGKGIDYINFAKDGTLLFVMPNVKSSQTTAPDLLAKSLDVSDPTFNVILPYGKVTVKTFTLASNNNVTDLVDHEQVNIRASSLQFDGHSNQLPIITAKKEIVIGGVADVSYPQDKDYILVGIVDAELGYRNIAGHLETATSGASKFGEHVWLDGKVQLYFKGIISGKTVVTASINTEQDSKELYSLLDADSSYAVYGDQSSVIDLANERNGSLYLLVERDESWAKWGKINPEFKRTHLAKFQRSLEGFQAHYESQKSDLQGQPKTELDLFDARAYQKAAHVEYSSPTGSIFYLKHNQVVANSLQLRLETRDRINGNVILTTKLKQGVDYQFDAAGGRISLNRPLVGNNSSYTLISAEQSSLDGNHMHLVASYSYVVIDDWDKGIKGYAVRQSINDHISVGLMSVIENQANSVYQLEGFNTRINIDKQENHMLDFEYAQSQSRVTPKHVSTDGGLSWGISESPVSSADSDTKGKAISVQGRSSFRDSHVQVDYYYRNIDEGFSSEATHYQQGWEAAGQNVNIKVNPKLIVVFKHDSQWRKGAGDSQSNNRVGAKSSHLTTLRANQKIADNLVLSAELRHQEADEPDPSNQSQINTDMDAVALQGHYQVSENTNVTLKQQFTLKGHENKHTAIDLRHRISERLAVKAGGSYGNLGTSAYGGVNYHTGEKVNLNTNFKYGADNRLVSIAGMNYSLENGQSYSLSASDERGSDQENLQGLSLGVTKPLTESTVINAGISTKLSSNSQRNSTNATLTHQLDENRSLRAGISNYAQESTGEYSIGNDITLGVDLDSNWAIDLRSGQGYVHLLDGSMNRRITAALGASYIHTEKNGDEQLRGILRYEYVNDIGHKNRYQHLFKIGLRGKYSESTTLFSELDWAQNKDRSSGSIEAKDNQLNLGFAFRPVTNDKVNVVAKYSWIDKYKPDAQTSNSGLKSLNGHVLSADILYDISYQWAFGGRLALRKAQETITGMPETNSITWLTALNARRYFDDETWASAEYRMLNSSLTNDQKDGLAVEIGRRFGDDMEFAVGYNWAGYNTDLADLDYNIDEFQMRLSYILE